MMALDEKGVPDRIIEDKVVNYLIELIHPVIFSANEDIYFYHNGVYKEGGETLIKQILNKGFLPFRNVYNEPIISIKQSNELVEKIKFLCMDERDNFDKDLAIINMRNGLYNWQTGEFKGHDWKYKSLIQIPVIYNKAADCPIHRDILHEIVPKEYYILALEYFAYLLYRSYNIQSCLILYGPGGTGKSVFLSMMRNFVGGNNCVNYSLHSLTTKQFSIYRLYNMLLNECGDLDNNVINNTGIFKQASGRDMLTGERKFLDPIYFKNFAKFVFSTNELPPIKDNSTGLYRRIIILLFLRKFKQDEYDYDKLAKLETDEEISGLFNMIIPLLPELIKRSYFKDAPSSEETHRLYDALSDPLTLFARKCIYEDPSSYGIFKSTLYQEYVRLCRMFNQTELDFNDFNREIQKQANYLKTGQKMNKQLGKKQTSWIGVSLSHIFD
jgi:putative DNA primase/helicase